MNLLYRLSLAFIFLSLSCSSEDSDDTACIDESKIDEFAVCIEIYEPVCGCDGVTYINSGEATCNNIFEWTQGPCDSNTNLMNYNFENKKIIQVVDLKGRIINSFPKGQFLLLIFDDGTIEKTIIN